VYFLSLSSFTLPACQRTKQKQIKIFSKLALDMKKKQAADPQMWLKWGKIYINLLSRFTLTIVQTGSQ
jgi:hypothetical protein